MREAASTAAEASAKALLVEELQLEVKRQLLQLEQVERLLRFDSKQRALSLRIDCSEQRQQKVARQLAVVLQAEQEGAPVAVEQALVAVAVAGFEA